MHSIAVASAVYDVKGPENNYEHFKCIFMNEHVCMFIKLLKYRGYSVVSFV